VVPEMDMTRTAILTGAWGPMRELAAQVSARLEAEGWAIRACGPFLVDSPEADDVRLARYIDGDLRDGAFVGRLFDGLPSGGRTVVVHLAPLVAVAEVAIGRQPAPLVEALDVATRGTYVLYKACVAAGVSEAVQASSLASMDAYDDAFEVTEQWRPRPAPTAVDLAPHLCESMAIEFTRDPMVDHPMAVTCLRFAEVVDGGTDEAMSPPADPRAMWVHDAAEAIVRAIAARGEGDRRSDRGHRFRLLHVASGAADARYTSAAAQKSIGYAPAFLGAGGVR
jgi:nucleoside-diphosphate-sugar epimerase